mmetsp:Transcript_3087/g.12217  ORF Transcript_3087/g.12217 Transcript_3087/m.12217 type:complete len:233 (+) Transcript_3087:1416-2114(+)
MPVPQRVPAREGHGVEGDATQARRVHRGSLLLQQAPRGDPGGHDLPRGLRRRGRTDGGPEEGGTRVVPRHAGAANGGEFDARHERGRVEPQRGDGARDRAVRHGPLHHARRRDRRVRRGPRRPRPARQRLADQVGFPRVPLLGIRGAEVRPARGRQGEDGGEDGEGCHRRAGEEEDGRAVSQDGRGRAGGYGPAVERRGGEVGQSAVRRGARKRRADLPRASLQRRVTRSWR